MGRKSIIEKIRKLFKLAENNTSEAEMTSALEQARKLLHKYGLSMEDIKESDMEAYFGAGEGWEVEVSVKGSTVWVLHLAAVIAEYFDCKVGRRDKTFLFYGPSLSAEGASYGFNSTFNQIMDLSKTYKVSKREYFIQGALARHDISSYSAYCKEAKREYRTGLAIGLEDHLKVLKEEEAQSATIRAEGALAVLSEDIADKWAEKNKIVVQKDKWEERHKVTGGSHCMEGLRDSDKVQLRKGLKAENG